MAAKVVVISITAAAATVGSVFSLIPFHRNDDAANCREHWGAQAAGGLFEPEIKVCKRRGHGDQNHWKCKNAVRENKPRVTIDETKRDPEAIKGHC